MSNKKLTEKQMRFCEEYLVDCNGTQAAIRAGYSEKTAQEIASENLSKPMIQQKIRELRAEQSKRTQITADRVLREAFAIGFSDVRKLFGDNGELLNPKDWPEDIVAAVAGVDVVENAANLKMEEGQMEVVPQYTKKVKLWDKNSALEKLFKHFGLYEKDNTQKNPILLAAEDLPLEVVQMIQERLRGIRGDRPELSGQSDAGTGGHTTH